MNRLPLILLIPFFLVSCYTSNDYVYDIQEATACLRERVNFLRIHTVIVNMSEVLHNQSPKLYDSDIFIPYTKLMDQLQKELDERCDRAK